MRNFFRAAVAPVVTMRSTLWILVTIWVGYIAHKQEWELLHNLTLIAIVLLFVWWVVGLLVVRADRRNSDG